MLGPLRAAYLRESNINQEAVMFLLKVESMGWGWIRVLIFGTGFLIGLMLSGPKVASSHAGWTVQTGCPKGRIVNNSGRLFTLIAAARAR